MIRIHLTRHTILRSMYAVPLLLCLCTLGCGGGSGDGPKRFQVTGVVKFDGKPIPVGMIYFIPDTSKGNIGPGSAAEIKNGNYSTPSEGGIVGGPTIVKVDGFDGVSKNLGGEIIPNGSALFPTYEIAADLEKKNSKKDFEIDKSAAAGNGANNGGAKPFIY